MNNNWSNYIKTQYNNTCRSLSFVINFMLSKLCSHLYFVVFIILYEQFFYNFILFFPLRIFIYHHRRINSIPKFNWIDSTINNNKLKFTVATTTYDLVERKKNKNPKINWNETWKFIYGIWFYMNKES